MRRTIPFLLMILCFGAAHARESPVIPMRIGKPTGPVAFSPDGKHALSDPNHELKRYTVHADDDKIEIGAVNENASASFRALTCAVYDAPAEGDLNFIGFGVSNPVKHILSDSWDPKRTFCLH